jgi:hypothetical protein
VSDELDKASRYRDRELSAEEAKALEVVGGLPEKLELLDAVDATARQLPNTLNDAQLEALLNRVKRPARVSAPGERRWVPTVAAATVAALIAAVAVGTVSVSARRAWMIVPNGQVILNGEALFKHRHQGAPGQWNIEVSPQATAQLVSRSQGVLQLPAGTRLSHDQELRLERGNLVVNAQGLLIKAGDQEVKVDGTSVLSMEPAEGVARVTDVLNQFPSGDQMKSQWMRLSTVAMTGAVAGGGLTLFVLDGHASVGGKNMLELKLAAGEWAQAGDSHPTSWKGAQASALSGEPTRPVGSAPSMQRGDPRIAAMSRPELVALVEKVLDEKEAVVREREGLKKKVAELEEGAGADDRNYYRFQPEELVAAAKRGELRLRGPQLEQHDINIDSKVRDDLALTPEEEAKVKAIYEASADRARASVIALYRELGGDANAASTLSTNTLLAELRDKALKDEYPNAVRQLANERVGLTAKGDPNVGPPILRAYRVFMLEDERVIGELEQLLGHRRAEEFLNHEQTSHSNHTFGVGPPKEK